MTEKPIEKAQFEGIIKEDKVIISDSEGIDEFFRNSYIGNLEQTEEGQETLVLDPIEVLLLIERNRLLIWENNNKNQEQYNFEKLLEYFIQYDNRLWQKYRTSITPVSKPPISSLQSVVIHRSWPTPSCRFYRNYTHQQPAWDTDTANEAKNYRCFSG